ncbi:MAG: M28 family peptidase [Pseudomonadota bacterium]
MVQKIGTGAAWGLNALLAALFALFLFSPQIIDAPRIDPDHPFDTAAAMERLARILGDEAPHTVDSDAGDAVIDRLLAEIRGLGFSPQVDEAFHCSDRWAVSCARVRNVGFWVGEPGPDAVMIASHHDSVPAGPGAADDGMGVVSSLEIARLMRARLDEGGNLPRPLYVLITDGEETGLIGASRFVEHDPVARRIGAVVSLEARGNRGPAAMFETSDPNGRDLVALRPSPGARIRAPVTSSLLVDIYRAMPNGTDVTEFLELDMDAANFAMGTHESHYHTRYDDLEHLNRRSVFHVGASALAAVDGFMGVDALSPDRPHVYGDLSGLAVMVLPQIVALPLVGLAALLCGLALLRTDRAAVPLWRVLLFPVAALLAGPGLAVLAGLSVTAIRPESAFGTAWPVAFRGLILAGSLAAAAGAARWLYNPRAADRHLAGAWAVVMALGVAASLLFPGASVLFALPALFVVPGAAALVLAGRDGRASGPAALLSRVLFATAALIGLALFLSLYAFAEIALFVEASAPLTVFVAWLFVVSLPLVRRQGGSARPALLGAGALAAVFAVAALRVPAYSEDAPLGRNLIQAGGDYEGAPYFIMTGRDGVPEPMNAVLPFAPGGPDSDFEGSWIAAAPEPDVPPAQLEVLRNTPPDLDGRTVELRITAPETDWLRIIPPSTPPAVRALSVNGAAVELEDGRLPFIGCTGRSCRELRIVLEGVRTADPIELDVRTARFGLGEAAAALLSARPAWTTPQHMGDYRLHRRHFVVPAAAPASAPAPGEN